jgi:midasin (ATPase involved in ribosome maturation)
MFACMNPGTQIGKKDLGFNLKIKFTELQISDSMDYIDIATITRSYLNFPDTHIDRIVKFF